MRKSILLILAIYAVSFGFMFQDTLKLLFVFYDRPTCAVPQLIKCLSLWPPIQHITKGKDRWQSRLFCTTSTNRTKREMNYFLVCSRVANSENNSEPVNDMLSTAQIYNDICPETCISAGTETKVTPAVRSVWKTSVHTTVTNCGELQVWWVC